MLNIPTLKCRRLWGDMIEMYRIITKKQDRDIALKFNIIPAAVTRGSIYKIRQGHVRYDLYKVSLWLDRFWNDQEVKYNWKADTKGTGSRSNVV